jgi:peptidyl-prolyl cis-trans isomerase A (cyclophilin A)
MQQAPDKFQVKFETSLGDFTVEAIREWSPNGVDRFYELVKQNFYDNTRIFRVVEGFVAQFGVSGDQKVSEVWKKATIHDDPVIESNTRGMLSYAMEEEKNSRTTQIFVNYADNSRLDKKGFTPFAKVTSGLETVEKFYSGYGARFFEQTEIEDKGNEFLDKDYPKFTKIIKAYVL